MKFLADMGISPATVSHLREQGFDAIRLSEQGLERLPDPEVLAKAKAEDRILLVHDLDFGELLAASGARMPSVITFRLRNMEPSHVNAVLDEILREHQAALESGAIISANEGRVRIRCLPI
jgi:predicted nuclease of predicted toxin-antitoxin system